MRERKQVLAPRDRDVNTAGQLGMGVALSALAHLLAAAVIVFSGDWFVTQPVVVPGYRVNLVTAGQLRPGRLEAPGPKGGSEAPAAKTPPPDIKKKPKIEKREPEIKEKIAPKSKTKAPPKKEAVKTKKKKPEPVKETPAQAKVSPAKSKTVPASSARIGSSSGNGGGGGGGAVAGGEEVPYLWYLQVIQRRVDDNWITHGIDVTAMRGNPTLRFVIARDGSVGLVRIEHGSGSDELDRSAREAIRAASPFGPLPDDYPNDSLEIFYTFEYEQRQ